MVTDKATSVTISDILASACGDLRPAMTAVAQLANQELVPGGTNKQVGCVCVCVRPVSELINVKLIKKIETHSRRRSRLITIFQRSKRNFFLLSANVNMLTG